MRILIVCLLSLSLFSPAHADDVKSDSIYQFKAQWQNANNKTVKLEDLAGKKQIVAMFYSHCATACPIIVADMQKIEKALSAKQKQQVGFVLVSLDAGKDSPETLAAFAKKRGLGNNWQLLHGEKEQVRALSMLLNVRYQKTDDGEIAHSKLLHLLDKQGRVLQQTSQVKDAAGLIKEWGL